MTTENTASSQIITVADRSVKAVAKAIAELLKVTADVGGLSTTAEQLADDIQMKESQLADLDRTIDNDFRTKKAQLALNVLENENATLKVLMANRNLATVTVDELEALAKELAATKAERDGAIEAAVVAASREINAAAGAKLAAQQSAHAVATAQASAQLESLADRNTFLTGEITALRGQIEAERNTRLEVARADAGRQGVVVNAGKQ